MNDRLYHKKLFIVIPVAFYYFLQSVVLQDNSNMSIESIIYGSLFGLTQLGNIRTYALVIEKLTYLIVFSLVFGNFISKDFILCADYVFSRIKDRRKWFYRKIVKLALYSVIYVFLFLLVLLFAGMLKSNYSFTKETIITFLSLWNMISLFLFGIVLLINCLSIKFSNNTIGFLTVYITLISLVSVALYTNSCTVIQKNIYLLFINPVTALILNTADNTRLMALVLSYYLLIDGIIIFYSSKIIEYADINITADDKHYI